MLYRLSYTGEWWGCLDSNQGTQRERIYSPPQLPLCHIPIFRFQALVGHRSSFKQGAYYPPSKDLSTLYTQPGVSISRNLHNLANNGGGAPLFGRNTGSLAARSPLTAKRVAQGRLPMAHTFGLLIVINAYAIVSWAGSTMAARLTGIVIIDRLVEEYGELPTGLLVISVTLVTVHGSATKHVNRQPASAYQ